MKGSPFGKEKSVSITSLFNLSAVFFIEAIEAHTRAVVGV